MKLDDEICDQARLARDARYDGRFFIGVLSTGIYCRPICPSPPAKRKNVRFFESPAAAVEAGFRPCLRCRPEVAPGTPAWQGTSATVTRALRLIGEGDLDERGIEGLAGRLGVSSRHLHRLFRVHLGASPSAVVQTRRLHFAKQLISDTKLPMFRVAQASGFRSVRRFNDSIRRLYGRTPSQLRRVRPAPIRARPDEYVFRLPYRPPYDWESLLSFLGRRAIPGVEQVVSGAYRRSFAVDGRHGILEVRHDPRAQALEARIRLDEPISLLPIVTRLRALFDLAADTSPIAQQFGRDPLLGPLVARFPGLRVPGAWSGFELAVRAILGQQVSVVAASTVASQLAGRFGERLSLADPGGLTLLFPPPEALADTVLPNLPPVRAQAIRALARAVVSGDVGFSAADDGSVSALARIPGVGPWTAQYVAMRALREPDAFPMNDLVLLRTAGRGTPLAVAELAKRAERWRPWRAYAALYLWRGAGATPRESSSRAPKQSAAGR